jgi:hypothetical protein
VENKNDPVTNAQKFCSSKEQESPMTIEILCNSGELLTRIASHYTKPVRETRIFFFDEFILVHYNWI